MKFYLLLAAGLLACASCRQDKQSGIDKGTDKVDTTDATLDFYDNEKVISLKGDDKIRISGETDKNYEVDFSGLPVRSVIVKEMLYGKAADSFVGAYRYDGYAIDDILNNIKPEKVSSNTFKSNIDLYVVISNNKGDSVTLSWGEIVYPVHRHEIIIATKVMRIVPSKTHDLWPLPVETKLIVASDLMTERNISNPSLITIRSARYKEKGGLKGDTSYVKSFNIYNGSTVAKNISAMPEGQLTYSYPTVFYGRGKGIHSVTPFKGVMVKNMMLQIFPVNKENIKNSIFVAAGNDEYRATFSYSEIMNRNDQAELLLVEIPRDVKESGGKFRLFPASDFFSDRSVRSLTSLIYFKGK